MVDWVNNTVQMFNEWCLLCSCIFLFNFTEYCPYAKMRYELGWWFLYFLYFNLAINVIIIFVTIY